MQSLMLLLSFAIEKGYIGVIINYGETSLWWPLPKAMADRNRAQILANL